MTSVTYNVDDIPGLTLIRPTLYRDHRGENFESFDTRQFAERVLNNEALRNQFGNRQFVLDTFSKSKRGTFRGLHGDNKTWKLVSCLYGEIYCTVLQPETKKTSTFILDSNNREQVLVPNDCVNGHYCISDQCLFNYKMTEHYGGIESQYTVKWHDSRYDFQWPFDIRKAIISDRDS